MKIVNKSKAISKAAKLPKKNRVRHFIGGFLKNTGLLKNIGLIFVFLILVFLMSYFASPKKLTSDKPFTQVYTVIESEGGTYLGAATDLVYSGIGEFQYIEGGIYKGGFVDSLRDGKGTYIWDNGDYFEGIWSADRMVAGTFTYANGLTYTGTFTDGMFGSGSFDSETTFASGGTYVGDIEHALRGGKGVFVWINGDSFSGIWENDQMASGTYTFADGSVYKGTFKNNKYNTGTFTLSALAKEKGFSCFEAMITSGKVSGFKFETIDGLSYDGDITGEASITYKSGNKYVGNVKNGVRHGNGIFKWIENSIIVASYNGGWTDGVMNGNGSYYYSANSYPYITGTFVNGKPAGRATYYKESGNTFNTIWSDGKCVEVK